MAATRLTTPLSERLGLEVPIFQAPMASVGTPALAAAVSRAGGLGALGCAFIQPDAMRRDVAALRSITETYRAALLAAREDDTSLTDRFSGKPARGLRNRRMRETAAGAFPRLPFPAQNQLTAKLRSASAQTGSPDFMALWAGQAVALSGRLPAAELLRELEREMLEVIDRVAKRRSTGP